MHRDGGFQGNLSPRMQKGYCCFSLLRDFRAGPLTHSPCHGGINDPKQLPLGIPTHQNIFVTYMILRILYSYTNTSILLLCAKSVKSEKTYLAIRGQMRKLIILHNWYAYLNIFGITSMSLSKTVTSQQTYLAIRGQIRKLNNLIILHI